MREYNVNKEYTDNVTTMPREDLEDLYVRIHQMLGFVLQGDDVAIKEANKFLKIHQIAKRPKDAYLFHMDHEYVEPDRKEVLTGTLNKATALLKDLGLTDSRAKLIADNLMHHVIKEIHK